MYTVGWQATQYYILKHIIALHDIIDGGDGNNACSSPFTRMSDEVKLGMQSSLLAASEAMAG